MGYCLSRVRTKALAHCARQVGIIILLCSLVVPAGLPQQAHAAWGQFSVSDEAELGQKIRMSIRAAFPLVEDPEIVNYIASIVARLEAAAPQQLFPFSVNVIRHNVINAFAVPGGNLFVFTGLILAMEHEAELAGVIAHEMAHASQRHIASRIEKMQKISMLSLVGAVAGAFLGGQGGGAMMAGSMAAGQAAMLSYSRADEVDADHVGMTYLIGGGYPPQGMVSAFEKISRQQWLLGLDIPSYLSTHPAVAERINTLSVRINALPKNVRFRPYADESFIRMQTLVRARYADAEQALQFFSKQQTGPRSCLSLMGQGIVHARLNRVSEAAAAFEKAVACSPNDSLVLREAGVFHYQKGTQKLAPELLQKAITRNPKDYVALFFYARTLADGGDLKTAQEYFKDILTKLPEDSEVHFYYARVLGQDKQLFLAHLHMAYSALYMNERVKVETNHAKAKSLAKSSTDIEKLKRFERLYKEREEIMKMR